MFVAFIEGRYRILLEQYQGFWDRRNGPVMRTKLAGLYEV